MIPGHTSADMRAFFLRWRILPLVAAVFDQEPQAQSVTLAVAQYWDDEAQDAVHLELLPSPARDPGWPVAPLDAPRMGSLQLREAALREVTGCGDRGRGVGAYGDNYSFIVAFAAYCAPGAHQNMSVEEAFQPYAVLRRGEGGVEVELVGALRQPEWEDRFHRPSRTPIWDGRALRGARSVRAQRGALRPQELVSAGEGWGKLAAGDALLARLRACLEAETSPPPDLLAALKAWMLEQGVSP